MGDFMKEKSCIRFVKCNFRTQSISIALSFANDF
jgi:hypothetical protein